jgi:hypothetical protein
MNKEIVNSLQRIHSFQISDEERMGMLLDKCEAMSVLCQKATQHWSLIKFIFQIPLILTSSVMCILNSFDDDKGSMKIPNVVVNGTSVLILALQNNLKVPEKVELFKSLSNNFLQLAHQLEGIEQEDISKNNINTFTEKYDSLVIQCQFEDIPKKIKMEIIDLWNEEQRSIPLQLNGASGIKRKKNSRTCTPTSPKSGNMWPEKKISNAPPYSRPIVNLQEYRDDTDGSTMA